MTRSRIPGTAAVLLALALPVTAQVPPAQQAAIASPQPGAATGPNPIQGRRIAAIGGSGGAAACAQCHGLDGTADGSGAFPRLSAQAAYYLYKQLGDYASGARQNAIMGPIARALSDAERQDVASYYAALDSPYFPAPTVTTEALQRGGTLSALGASDRGVQACVNCHGPAALGQAPAIPQLAGQYAAYIRTQFQMFRGDFRRNDIAGVMRDISRRLSDDDVAAVAAYLETIRPGSAR